jgi:hypothetical protein
MFPGMAVLSEVLDPGTSRIVGPGDQSREVPELRNAIAVCDSWEHCKVAVMRPVVPLKLNTSPKKFAELKSKGYEFGASFQKSFMETLANRIDCTPGVWECNPRVGSFWDEGIDRQKTLKDLEIRGVTHVICGQVESVNVIRTEVHIGIMRLSRGENGEVVEGPLLDSIKVLLAGADL